MGLSANRTLIKQGAYSFLEQVVNGVFCFDISELHYLACIFTFYVVVGVCSCSFQGFNEASCEDKSMQLRLHRPMERSELLR
jgi:hypothetical protein